MGEALHFSKLGFLCRIFGTCFQRRGRPFTLARELCLGLEMMNDEDGGGGMGDESETISVASSLVSEDEEGFIVPPTRWDELFGGSRVGEFGASGSFTLEDVMRLGEASREGENERDVALEGTLSLPTLDPSLYKNKGYVRVDIDSIKGLVHLEDAMDIFYPCPLRQRGAFFLERECPLSFAICSVLSKNTEHINGLGFGNQVMGIRKSGNISIPKVPKPLLPQDLDGDAMYLTWPFPSLEDVRPNEWLPLGDFPHFVLCEAKGRGGVKFKLWCIPFGAFTTKTNSNKIKRLAQRVLHQIKYVAINALTRIIAQWTVVEEGSRVIRVRARDLQGVERVVYERTRRWMTTNDMTFSFFEHSQNVFLGWNTFEGSTSFSSGNETYALHAPAMDVICKLFPMVVDSSSLDLSVMERAALRHAMVYLDAKGLKDCLHNPSLLGSLHPDLVAVRANLEDMVPSLRLVSKGLCRVDVAYEWTIKGEGVGLMWSLGGLMKLVQAMPPTWRRATKLYPCLGTTRAVDLQAHLQHWYPLPRGEQSVEVHGRLPHATPMARGPTYMEMRIPNAVLEAHVPRGMDIDEGLFDNVQVLNIYCPGPRRLSSSLGKRWGLGFDGVAQVLAVLSELGEGVGLREALLKALEKAQVSVQGFALHVEREMPAQQVWSLRAEVGANSFEEAVRLLDFWAKVNRLDHESVFVEGNSMSQLERCVLPIAVDLRTLARYTYHYIDLWWKEVRGCCQEVTVSSRNALQASVAELLIKHATFLVRGQNPWVYSVAKILLHGGVLKHGILLPNHVRRMIDSMPRTQAREVLSRTFVLKKIPRGGSVERVKWQSLCRVLKQSGRIRSLLEGLESRSPLAHESTCLQVCLAILETFYEDCWCYMVAKGHWEQDSNIPSYLSYQGDVMYNVEQSCTTLSHPMYNKGVAASSRVHPVNGVGRRTVAAFDFVSKWFPEHSRMSRDASGPALTNYSKWFYATHVLWDIVSTTLNTEDSRKLRNLLERVVGDARILRGAGGFQMDAVEVQGLLVPDGAGPTRPFNTLNHWLVVVGGAPAPFVPPRMPSIVDNQRVVTRQVLREEHNLFRARSKRGFTSHEHDVFSMYVLLEGGEDRLNDINHARHTRSSMNHFEAFVDPSKATLYCFRLRRTVEQVTDKFNSANRCRRPERGQWSLLDMEHRIQRCLGRNFLGGDGRINKIAAREWLVANQGRTLRDYRHGWSGEQGPPVDPTNINAWEAHLAIQWTHPVPVELMPVGYGGSRGHHHETRSTTQGSTSNGLRQTTLRDSGLFRRQPRPNQTEATESLPSIGQTFMSHQVESAAPRPWMAQHDRSVPTTSSLTAERDDEPREGSTSYYQRRGVFE